LDRINILARLRRIRGHLPAIEWLVAQDRLLDAALQLRAVRGAITKVMLEACRAQVEHCRGEEFSRQTVDDLVSMARLVTAPAKCARRTRWRSMSVALHGDPRN
jgi:DNA-binding FrmR family transcriptional regulator